MTGMQVELPVLARAGHEFTFQASQLAVTVDAFAAGSQIPSSAIGSIGPGQGVLDAYQALLAHVTEHLHSLRQAVDETGRHLTTSAAVYDLTDRRLRDQVEGATAHPGW